jgi:hypothetical protein
MYHVVLVSVLVLQDNNDSENFNAQLMLCSSICQSDAQNKFTLFKNTVSFLENSEKKINAK